MKRERKKDSLGAQVCRTALCNSLQKCTFDLSSHNVRFFSFKQDSSFFLISISLQSFFSCIPSCIIPSYSPFLLQSCSALHSAYVFGIVLPFNFFQLNFKEMKLIYFMISVPLLRCMASLFLCISQRER